MTAAFQPGDLVIYTAAPGKCFHARVIGPGTVTGIEILLGDDYVAWEEKCGATPTRCAFAVAPSQIMLARRAWPQEIEQARALRAAYVAGARMMRDAWLLGTREPDVMRVAADKARREYPGPE